MACRSRRRLLLYVAAALAVALPACTERRIVEHFNDVTTTTAAAVPSTTVTTAAPATTAPPAPPPSPSTTQPPTATTLRPSIDARRLASELADAEATIRDADTSDADVVAAGEAQQLAYRDVATDAALRSQLIAAVPPSIRSAVAANAGAVAELAAMVGKLKDQAPTTWRIVAPAAPADLLTFYKEAGQAEGVPWQVLASIHLVETRMGRIRGTSTAGAQGPMQFLPSTWTHYGNGGDINDNRDAIFGAARLLRQNGVARGDIRAAVYSYNHSQRYVNAVLGFADVMKASERAYFGYHAWQVFYKTTTGDVLLPVGYGE